MQQTEDSRAAQGCDDLNAVFVRGAEFRQEQKLAEIASLVSARPPSHRVRVIAIAGPTSSGKTTFSHKLCAYLKNHGIQALPLSVDHYYYELNEQPVFKRTGNRCACVCACVRACVRACVC